MAEVTREIVEKNRGSGFVAWLALILAAIALTIAWLAYNRTGQDLEDRIQNQVQETVPALDDAADETAEDIDEGPDNIDENTPETVPGN